MRMSIVKGDPGAGPCYGVKVFLNGVEVKRCRTFDTDLGFVDYIPEPVRSDPEDPTRVYVRRVFGKVTFDASKLDPRFRAFYGIEDPAP